MNIGMRKSLFFGMRLVLIAIMLPANLSAQETIGHREGIWTDSVVVDTDVDEVIEIVVHPFSVFHGQEKLEDTGQISQGIG